MHLEIRQLCEQDINSVCEIEKLSFPDPWSYEGFKAEIKNPFTYSLVAYNKDFGIVGYLISRIIFDEAHILNIATHPEFRKRGVATSLLENFYKNLKEKNVKRIILEVRKKNLQAQNLYKKLGFRIISIRVKYYSNGDDALIMVKDIGE